MDLRNYNLIQDRLGPYSIREKSKRRFMTQFSQNKATWFTTQKQVGVKKHNTCKFTNLFSQSQNNQKSNSLKKVKKFQQLVQQGKKIAKLCSRKNSWQKNENISQSQLLKAHLDSIPVRKNKNHNRAQTQSTLYFGENTKPKIKNAIIPMDRINYSKCCGLVDDIYQKIDILKQIGYSDGKIDSWVLAFCEGRKPFMKTIFMRNINYSIYSLKEEFQYEKDFRVVKERIKFQIRKNKDVLNYVEVGQLSELSYYLEQILIQKNMKKAKEVQQSILEKLSLDLIPKAKNDFCLFTKKKPTQVYDFFEQIPPFESKFGDFVSFCKINKLRFLELSKVQNNLKATYKQMLENQNKKVQKLKCKISISNH